MSRATSPVTSTRRRRLVALIATFAVVAMSAQATAAAPVPAVARVTGEWVEPPAQVTVGELLVAQWLVEIDPPEGETSAEPLEDLTAELTLENGRFADIPEQCLTEGTDSPSELSDDGATLSCNVGTKSTETSAAIQTLVTADGPDGATVSGRGAIGEEESELPPVTIVDPEADEEPEATEPEAGEETEAGEAEASEPEASEEEAPAAEGRAAAESETAEAAEAPAADDAVAARSVNPANTYIRADNTFYAYVGAGENLDVLFTKEYGTSNEFPLTVTVRGPGGEVSSCPVIAGTDPAGSSCSLPNRTSATAGVWQITFDVGAGSGGGDYFSWAIDVQSGTTSIPGRVYSETYAVDQTVADGFPDVTLWYQGQNGFLYEADYLGFNGVGATFQSNATGNALVGTCTSAYESVGYIGLDDDSARVTPTTTECGDRYKIFFEEPDPAMPDTATVAGGGTTWLTPPLELPDLSNLAFAQDAGSITRTGEFTFDVTGHQGTALIQIDANRDGDYEDPEDREISVSVTADGTVSTAFDGLDGEGNPLSILEPLQARVVVDQAGEIHFVNTDVEVRAGGIEVTKLNGPDAGSTTLYWNDTSLSTTNRLCTTSPVDGRAGLPSAGGVHGWDCSTATSIGNQNTGNGGSWGDTRYIDDWTYHTYEEADTVVAAAEMADFGDAVNGYGTDLSADGAHHGVPDLDDASDTAPLMLGARIDTEADGVPGASAQGDDTDGVDDEDAVLSPIGLVIGQPTQVPVRVTNDTAEPATLAGWIDLNDDGDFDDSGELQRVVVSANSGLTTQTLTFPAVGAPGDGTFARFRLFAGDVPLANLSPTGPAAAGEVEDYTVIGPVPIFLECPNVYALQGSSPYNLYEVNTGTGGMTSVGQIDGTGSLNALAVSPDGRYVYAYGNGDIWVHDTYTGDTQNIDGPASGTMTHGAVDLATGFYYFGTVSTTGGTIYGFDPNTNTSLGVVANIDWDIDAAGGNGDMAFDSQGNVYLVAGTTSTSALYVVSDPLPTTGPAQARSGQRIATIDPDGNAINGMAFDGSGYLYVASGTNILQLNPSTGATINTEALSTSGSVDLGSCSSPASITVQKDVVGRAVATDQFQVNVTGGGISQNNTGTTAGTDTGLQTNAAEMAGPVLGLPGTEYTIGEVGTGGADLADYEIEWECVNESLADEVVASGTGATGSFTMPDSIAGAGAAVVCTITNAPVALDFGDAPNSYGTSGAGAARHAVPDLIGTTAPVMLGGSVDGEADGQPTAAADGDGADEDGVAFNPALGYPNATLRTGTDPVTGLPVTNTLEVEASADGFVSVWVDWNMDGDFLDAGEQVANAAAVTAGTNPITFPQGTNPPGIDTYVRVRYSTDAASIATPTGAAPDGEVEDYAVLVERLVQPDACVEGTADYYAFTFSQPVDLTGTGGVGSTARYEDVTVVGGVAIDMFVEVVSGGMSTVNAAYQPNGFAVGDGGAFGTDDATWAILSDATLRYSFYEAGTTTPVPVNAVFTVSDMDGTFGETATFSAADLASYAVTQGSAVQISESGGDVVFAGSGNWNGDPESRFQVALEGQSSFDVHWEGINNSGFGFDGDGDLEIEPVGCEDYGDAPDTYGTTAAANGPNHTVTGGVFLGSTVDFDPNGQPTAGADGDDTNRVDDEDGVEVNPALGYPNATLRTGTDPVTGLPVTNTLDVEASADGFVSVWVDWNMDGDFLDAGEQVANAAAVTAGTNPITFPQGTNPPGIDTYVRVRYSTDAASIATPTGAAPDGEVEDYAVLVERLVQPDACIEGAESYYAFTFSTPVTTGTNGNVGNTALYEDVTVVGGVAVDMFVEVIAGDLRETTRPPNGFGVGSGTIIQPDDAQWNVQQDATLRYTFYEAGTTTPITVNGVFTISDMDGPPTITQETGTFSAADLASYAVAQGSAVTIVENGGNVQFQGNGDWDGDPQSRFQIVLEGLSTFDARWTGAAGSGFGFDGDSDLDVEPVGCEDYGDAPDSYDTTAAENGPNHTVTAGVHLGGTVEFDPNGQPTAGADGDDTNRIDDEDGVDFNASLGYPNATLRTGTDPVTGLPVTNTLDVEASADGFVSVWVDWNMDGDFLDAGEQVANAAAVTAGTTPITFPQGTNPPGIDTYVRVRYSTDADSIATPTGSAPDGEVEDYAVLVERLLEPQVCTTDVGEQYAFTFSEPTSRTGTGGVGSTALYSRVSVINGVPVDMVIEVVAGDLKETGSGSLPPNGLGVGDGGATGIDTDDARWQVSTDATLRYTFYEAGTTTPVSVNAAFTVNDMDGNSPAGPSDETATFSAADLAAYGVSQGSGVQITTPGSDVVFTATTSGAGTITQRFQFVIEGISTFDVDWHGFNGSGFGFDGDGDLSIQPVGCEDYGDAPETYGTTAAANGPAHTVSDQLYMGGTVEFDPNGQPTTGADGDDTNRVDDEDGPTAAIAITPGAETSVTIDVVNTTGGPATLAGWIDLDGSGTFDAGELVSISVDASGPYTLTFPAGTTTADTYARFRLYPGTPTTLEPTGAAAGGEVEDHLVEVFTTEVEKTVGSVVANADGTHTVTYEIDVTRTGDGAPYDLDDVLMVGSAVTVVGPVTATNTAPGSITTRTDFDGQGQPRIADDVPIADGVTHTYEVEVVVEIDTAALTFANSDCTLGGGETGTGLMNRASATVGSAATTDEGCREISVPTHEKVVSAGPTPQGNGVYRIDYTITVTNAGAAASEYDLEDELLYGDAVTVSGTPVVTNTSPGTIATNSGWDGETDTVVVTDEPIAAGTAGGPTTHTYAVVVFVTVDGDQITFENSDCSLGSGETDTGLLNETTLTVDQREDTDEACPDPLAEPTHTKDVVSGPTALGDGRYEVEYQITVTNPSSGAGVYDLADELQYGDAVTIEAGPTLTAPAGVTPNAGWDGQGDTTIVTGQAIPAGTAGTPATHVYTVRVEVSIDGAGSTAENLDCTLDQGEDGTGLLNTATLTVNGEDVDDDACPDPPATPIHSKVVSSGPTAAGDGLWDVEYTITVTNSSPTAGEYDLDDAFQFGGAITIEGDPTVTASPAGITPEADWNGQDQTVIVADQPIAAGASGAPAVHTYVVTVQISLDETAVTFENSDCTLGAGEDGTGLLNSATMTVDGTETEETACPDPPAAPTHDKDVVSGPTALGNGRYEVEYEITVTNPSAGAGTYDLSDELQYGEAVTIEAGPTLTAPAGVTPNAGWDGQTDTVIVDDQAIGAGAAGSPATHVYTVRVEVSIDAETATFENSDCSLTTGETGTGLLNTTTLSQNGETEDDDACPPPPATPIHDKEVVSGPTAIGGGRYEVEYAITVTNASPSAGTYDLSDTLRYGDAVTIEAGPTLTAPAGVTPNAGWDGEGDTTIVTDQAIPGGTAGSPATHVYTVRVEVSTDAATATNETMDCSLDAGEDGTGLLNTATLTVNGEDTDDDACPPPPGVPTHTKEVSSGPTAVGDGLWEIQYVIEVVNDDPSAGTYDLDDAFRFGGAVTIEGDPVVENVTPGDIDTLDTWNGQDQTLIVDDQAIAAGSAADPEVHTYVVTVQVSLDETAVTFENSDCTLGAGEDGTGLLNESTLTVNDVEADDEACPTQPAAPTHTKDVVSGPTAIGGGRYEVEYEITVTNPSAGAGSYDLSDELQYGEAITIEAGPTLTAPAGVTPNAGWDGQTDTVIVDDQAIDAATAAGPATHVYTVRVEVSIDAETSTFENTDCSLGTGEDGTGLLNTATLSHNGEETDDDACPPPPATPVHTKDVVSGPTAIGGGRYEVEYEITVTNASAGAGEYDLSDTLQYGDAVTIEAGPTLTAPAGVTPNAGWDGDTDTTIVTDQAIEAGAAGSPATHVYTVRVEVSIDAATATNETMDCSLDAGEDGTGLLNTATLTVNGEGADDDACPPPPGVPTHTKEVSSGPTAVGDGVWEVEYTIEVVNDDPSPAVYDLEDAFRFGGAISIEGDPVLTAPDGVTPNAAWNGQDQTVIVDDATIAAGTPASPTVHTYTLTVQVRVDAATVSFETSDCTLGLGEDGTGLLNESTMTVNDVEADDDACPDPPAAPRHVKDVVSGPTAIGGGLYEVEYEITVTNASAGVGEYDLSDELQYGEAITIVGDPVLTATPASVTPNPAWDGRTETVIADDEPIEAATAAGPATHTYSVTVQVRVDADTVTFENSDCELTTGETGTGLLNTATLSDNGVDTADDACPPPIAAPTHDKEVTSGPTSLGDGRYEIGYTITVSNAAGSEGTYDLDDTLRYGEAVTIEDVVLTAPDGITPNPAWDGVADTSIVAGQAIEAGAPGAPAVHTYTVTVTAQVDGEAVTFENSDCALTDGEQGTGFLNESTMTVNEVTDTEQACPPPAGVISHTKEVTSGPVEVADGQYQVEYTITVTNTSAGEGTYDLDDELHYGDGLTIEDTQVANTAPGDIAVNDGWDGVDDIVVVSDQPIAAATADAPTVHTYVVTVTASSPGGLPDTALDCVVDGGEGGTGLNNHSTLTTDDVEQAAAACSEVIERDPTPVEEADPVDESDDESDDDSGDSDSLASTGAAIGLLVMTSLGLIVGGTALVLGRRRRLRGAR